MDSPIDTETLPHDNRGYVVIITVAVVLTVACFSVGLRIYTRAILLKQIGADDYLVLLALVLAIATGVSQCVNTRNGLGKHAWDLRAPDEILAYLKNFYVNIAFYYYRVLVLKKFRIVCIIASEASKGSKGSKHTRWDSQASNHTGAEGEDRLQGLDTSFGTGVRTSNGTLNSITGFRSTGPSLYGTSQASLANPEPTPMSIYARSLSGLNLHWTQPSVTTTTVARPGQAGQDDPVGS
ncbi:hypothetical protein NUW58_g4430 [Xylaria curta]|uniref:Uncharacterized protein n=2 Tax=Xylaria curta TaxID=42375 RepID=A0ACC1P828_9PEZI|nr:hypothetical protein NUW58_g4994 [Xylaria curta]KAJ2987574.1 hypothetical protein NUW58_g4430 [Xylaria curta]